MDDFAIHTDPAGHMGITAEDWLDVSACALLVIDVQRYGADRRYDLTRSHPFLREDGPDAYYRQVEEVALPAMQRLLAHFRKIYRPVVFLRYCSHDTEYRDMPHLWRLCNKQLRDADGKPFTIHPDCEATQIMPQVAPLDGEPVIDKTTNGGFASTQLDLFLRNLGIRCIVVCGSWTNACVETTVREAADRGYFCTVASDGCFGGGDRFHQASLRSMDRFYSQVLATDEIIRRLPA